MAADNITSLAKSLNENVKKDPAPKYIRQLRRVKRSHKQLGSAIELLWQWQLVMLVTFTETYLQDVLADVAAIDQNLIKDSKLSATYEEILSFDSIEQLALEVRRRWAARNFIDSGPAKWIERFRQMGAHNVDPALAKDLEELWGVRHLVVHQAGIVTQEFIRVHKRRDLAVGSQLTITVDHFNNYLTVVTTFVDQIDEYFVKRFRSLSESR